jgi:ribosomal protein S8
MYYPSYIINLININKLRKNLYFFLLFTVKNYQFVKILKKFNVIHDFRLIKKNKFVYIKITLFFYKNNIICYNFKIITRPAKIFNISYNSLVLLSKKTNSSIFFISTSKGILSHKEAILQKKGGMVLGFFSL